MPYTPEQLRNLEWYQTFLEADEENYRQNKLLLLERSSVSGSAGGSALIRDEENTILLFENPSKNMIEEDPNSRILHDTEVKRLKTKEGEREQFSIVGGSSGGKKQDVSTQTTSPRAPRSAGCGWCGPGA